MNIKFLKFIYLADFSGSTTSCLHSCEDSYYCKKPACRQEGGFLGHGSESVFMHSIKNFAFGEASQRTVASARLRSQSPASLENVDNLTLQAEKLLLKVRILIILDNLKSF